MIASEVINRGNDLLLLWQLPFMQRAFIAIAVLAIAASIIGVLINFRQLEFVSHALVHAVFPGLVAGMLLGGSALLLPGAALCAAIASVLFTLLAQTSGRSAPAIIANGTVSAGVTVVLGGLFSLGVVLVSSSENYVSQLQELLFGRVLTVSWLELWQLVAVSLVAVLLLALSWRQQIFRAFDPAGFAASGYSARRVDLLLNLAIALVVVAGVQALGVLLVVALLVLPLAITRLMLTRLHWLAPVAAIIICISGFGGVWISSTLSLLNGVAAAPGATIVLVMSALYALAQTLRWVLRRLRWRQSAHASKMVAAP